VELRNDVLYKYGAKESIINQSIDQRRYRGASERANNKNYSILFYCV
jgi:hypothetical protein